MSSCVRRKNRVSSEASPRPGRPPARAGDGNRTHVACLEGRYSTIELHPPGRSESSRGDRTGHGSRWLGPLRGCRLVSLAVPSRWGRAPSVSIGLARPILRGPRRWVEQDSNLRRQCHQIYSLAPLAAWVSTRLVPGFRHFHRCAETHSLSRQEEFPGDLAGEGITELAERLELSTLGLQNRCSAD
jgi:hypothetical protein